MKQKVALYCRVSRNSKKDLQKQISSMIENIKELNVNEERIVIYADKGYSAMDTERPEYKRLIADIRDGKFGSVYCWSTDTLSGTKSMLTDIVEIADENNCILKFMKEWATTKEGFFGNNFRVIFTDYFERKEKKNETTIENSDLL